MRLSVQISRDEITPEIKRLKSKVSATNMRTFLKRQEYILKNNISESFRAQVYFDGSSTRPWVDLKPATVERRTRRGTWSGSMSDSILKEFYMLRDSLTTRQSSVSSNAGIHSISMYPKGRHGMSDISIQGLALLHQEGTRNMAARPPYSWLPRFQDSLVFNFWVYIFN